MTHVINFLDFFADFFDDHSGNSIDGIIFVITSELV